MELEFNPEVEYTKCVFFIKDIPDSNELCLICMVDETEDGKQWTRYKLRCGHLFHSRCFRQWCGRKDRLNCSCCGDLPEDETSMYCDRCDEFGHSCAFNPRGSEYKHKRHKLK